MEYDDTLKTGKSLSKINCNIIMLYILYLKNSAFPTVKPLLQGLELFAKEQFLTSS